MFPVSFVVDSVEMMKKSSPITNMDRLHDILKTVPDCIKYSFTYKNDEYCLMAYIIHCW